MELRHLEVFVAVAEELSFTRASARLHLVQSGVSSASRPWNATWARSCSTGTGIGSC